jgi:UDP-2,4-diacetamido-2,4,6-trideoxy-beta-L-altropyranose hydrolase
MRIAIRVDASTQIGMGHVVRCVTLAEVLRKQSAEVIFICRSQSGDCIDWIRDSGFTVLVLPHMAEMLLHNQLTLEDAVSTQQLLHAHAPFEWLIVDHYEIDHNWESMMREFVRHIMVIDDLANRQHDCDLLLDQNFYLNYERRYKGLLPKHCKTCLGPSYVMLREEFYSLKNHLRQRDGAVKHLMCFYGASDPTGETLKAIPAIQALNNASLHVDVVIGNANPAREQIAAMCIELPGFTYHCQTNRMAELCAQADIAIGAGGSANWERAFLGLPSLVTITADNQTETTHAICSVGGAWLLGEARDIDESAITAALQEGIHSPERLQNISRTALSIMSIDGVYGAHGVVRTMFN